MKTSKLSLPSCLPASGQTHRKNVNTYQLNKIYSPKNMITLMML